VSSGVSFPLLLQRSGKDSFGGPTEMRTIKTHATIHSSRAAHSWSRDSEETLCYGRKQCTESGTTNPVNAGVVRTEAATEVFASLRVKTWLGLLVRGSYRDAIRVGPRIHINKEEI